MESKPLKILYIITKSNWGGAQRHIFDLATGMKQLGHEVHVALGGKGALLERLMEASVHVHSIDNMGRDINIGSDISSFFEIFKIIKRLNPDVVHVHSPKAAGLGALAARLLGIKNVLYTVHGWAFNEDRNYIQKTLIGFFSWLTVLLSHKVINLSEQEYHQTTMFPGGQTKAVVIPLGITPTIMYSKTGARDKFREMLGLDVSKRFIIGTIGELHVNKGYDYALEAMKEIVKIYPEVLYCIIGEGERRKHIEDRITTLGLSENVRLLGFVQSAPEYSKAFDLFLLPSVKEGLPYVLMEVGLASVACISTNVGGIPSIIEDMYSGILIQPRKVQEITQSIDFMIRHPKIRREYGESLRNKVTSKFSINEMLTSLEVEYRKVHQKIRPLKAEVI